MGIKSLNEMEPWNKTQNVQSFSIALSVSMKSAYANVMSNCYWIIKLLLSFDVAVCIVELCGKHKVEAF